MRRAIAVQRTSTKLKKQKEMLVDEKLRELGHMHFSEDFPNPERKGCPPRGELKLLAEKAQDAEDAVLDHISFCSPCYQEYGGFLRARKAHLRKKRQK
jgi:hypothetical protein